jgi:hypothetical protein
MNGAGVCSASGTMQSAALTGDHRSQLELKSAVPTPLDGSTPTIVRGLSLVLGTPPLSVDDAIVYAAG